MESPLRLPEIQTARLLLRPLEYADAPSLFAYACDPEVARYTNWPVHQSLADSEKFVKRAIARLSSGTVASWGVVDCSTGMLIGTCGFAAFDPLSRTGELAYAFARHTWGRGLATEATRAAMTCGFTRFAMKNIEASCHAANLGSIRVLEKIGLWSIPVSEKHLHMESSQEDVRRFRISYDAWNRNRA